MPDRRAGPGWQAAEAALHRALQLVVRRGLRGVWLRGQLPLGPFVWAANHHSWWDPFVAMAALRRLRRSTCLLMRQQNLDRYAFARPLGVFGTGEHRHGVGLLRAGRVLIIYPEGELRPAGRPAPLAAGAAWYADRARVPLYAAATRVLLRGQQHPEAYLLLSEVPEGTTAALADRLAAHLSELDQAAAAADPRQPLPGFTPILRGRRSADEQVDRLPRRWPWRR